MTSPKQSSSAGHNRPLKPEYSWSDGPLVTPVSLDPEEWNALYVVFFLAECTGSKVHLVHVKNASDSPEKKKKLLEEVDKFAKNLKVKYEFHQVYPKKDVAGVEDISNAIVQKSEMVNANAIVMAANRETFFRELFGRISDRVVRGSSTKVILVETPSRGIKLPSTPKKILIPILREEPKPDPFIIASALTSSASTPNVEVIVIRVVPMPPTIPLDASEVSDILRSEEQDFSLKISTYIQGLGRFFSPRMIAVRQVGEEVASFAKENHVDLIILQGDRSSGGYRSFTRSEKYEIVSKAHCLTLVVYS
ncbi:MAG: universal stress protein [Nitrososphaerales archaeon]